MAKMYVDKIFKHANRAVAEAMLAALRARFREALGDVEWMTAADRFAAQDKLDRMFFQVAYPTLPVNGSAKDVQGEGAEQEPYWPSAVTILDGHLGGDLFANHMLASRMQIQHMFKYIDIRPSRRAWAQVVAFSEPLTDTLQPHHTTRCCKLNLHRIDRADAAGHQRLLQRTQQWTLDPCWHLAGRACALFPLPLPSSFLPSLPPCLSPFLSPAVLRMRVDAFPPLFLWLPGGAREGRWGSGR